MEKLKIAILSDHALSLSGVANQTKFLIEGLIKKKDIQVVQLGSLVKLGNNNPVEVKKDFTIIPVENFGTKNQIRSFLINENPDALIIFQDPRFFIHIFEMEDEIRQICPILWWHVWDNYPIPTFNYWMYDSIDTINCHSFLTYEMCMKDYNHKTNYIPHAFPNNIFYKLSKKENKENKKRFFDKLSLSNRTEDFNFLWVNRNILRKRPGDLLRAWKIFQDMISELPLNANLILHTDPKDNAGHNLEEISKYYKIEDSVIFSNSNFSFKDLNILHNISDCCINISYNEGFGLSTLQSLLTGTPIIAVKTGGQTRQVVNCSNGKENGIALEVDSQRLNGNQNIPYIYEDYASIENIALAMFNLYSLSKEELDELGKDCRKYALKEYSYQNTVNSWYESIKETISNFKNKKKYILEEL